MVIKRGIRLLLILFITAMMLVVACSAAQCSFTCGPTQYSLSTFVSPEGSGSITPASGIYGEGTEVTLTAAAVEGYIFDHWSGDAAGTSTSVTITMDSAKSITAHFKAGLGTVVSGDFWEVKVVSVEEVTNLHGLMKSWSTKEGYSFLVVEVLINNTSAGSQEYHSDSISITDSEKRLYLPVGSESVGGYQLDITWTVTMEGPGEISGKTPSHIVFLVPNDAEGFYFKFIDLPEIYLGQ